MVDLLHTSDWHVGRTMRGRSRIEEHRQVLGEIATIAADRGVDLIVVAGDLFDVAAPSPEAEQVVFRALLDLAEAAPVLVVAGNHDNPRRLEAVAPLLELGRVTVVGAARRPDDGGMVRLGGLGVQIALLPWQSQRGIVTAADLFDRDAADQAISYEMRMRKLIGALTEGMSPDTVNVVVSHAMVHGAKDSGSERHAHIFGYAIPALAFPSSLSYVALGHLHRPQQVPAPAPVWYSGSPLQLDFGEVDDIKSVNFVTAEPGLPARVEPVPLTAGRRLVRLSGTVDDVLAEAGRVEDAWVKVELDEPARSGLADEIRSALPDVVDVTLVKPAAAERPVQGPQRLGRSPRELFSEYLIQRGVVDAGLEAMFGDLLEEAHET
ncbi:MAG: exonuclease SbcCD subunit D [Acidimicrobiia bacterium]|nr:exonuclease SbcCD subunit D [Acidimicrobiia bacterium]MDH4306578.1 exonuclease SbcCD subunit D [Acidimicrobiia bacterium]